MTGLRQGSIHLFRFAGIDLFLHYSWFLVALIEINSRSKSYSSISWNILEYLALFLIVMMHEFGHALACRQVGGTANRIVLWPLGGVAYVNPPQRPGATLWSIAAGPLVNAGAPSHAVSAWGIEPIDGVGGLHTQRPRVLADTLVHQLGFADLQYVTHLPVGWWPDSSFFALVCGRACPQLDGGHGDRICRRGRANPTRRVDAICLVWHYRGLHPHELLERTEASASTVAFGQVAAPRRVCLSVVQNRATHRSLLEV